LGLALRDHASPARGALCMGYANDYLGYIAPPEAWDVGGYEVNIGMWSIVGRDAYGMLLDTAEELTSDLWR